MAFAPLSRDGMATLVDLSERAMLPRLAEVGTTLQAPRDHVCAVIAMNYLHQSNPQLKLCVAAHGRLARFAACAYRD